MVEKERKKLKSKGKGEKNVEFTYDAPYAMEVFLAGEFNGWDIRSLPLKKDKSGVWKTKIKLPPAAMNINCSQTMPGLRTFLGQNFVQTPLAPKISSSGSRDNCHERTIPAL